MRSFQVKAGSFYSVKYPLAGLNTLHFGRAENEEIGGTMRRFPLNGYISAQFGILMPG